MIYLLWFVKTCLQYAASWSVLIFLDFYNRQIDSKCEKIVRRWSTFEESIEIAVFKKWFLWENFLIFMITKQSFLRRNDSIVILLYSVSHFDITSSIISAIIILSWEVVYIARKSTVVDGVWCVVWTEAEVNLWVNVGQ